MKLCFIRQFLIKIADKFKKLSKIGFSMEYFVLADFLRYCGKNFFLGWQARYWPSDPRI